MLEFASFSEGGNSRLCCLDDLVPVQRIQRADERTRTAASLSLRVSLFPTTNPTENGRFADTYASALSIKHPPVSPSIAATADNR
jgi:hypothetical protein